VKMIRVALILPHLGWGGVQTLLLVQTRDAAAFGVAYSVFSLAPPAKAPYADELARLGVEVVHEPGRRVLDVQRAQRLARRLNGGRFDVAHGHLWAGNLVGAWASALAGLPFLGGLHLPGPGSGARAVVRGWAEAFALCHGALAATACAEAVANANRRRLGRLPIIALTNPAPDRFPPGPAARGGRSRRAWGE